jgi:membrane protein
MMDLVQRLIRSAVKALKILWAYITSIAQKVGDLDILFLASGVAFNGVLTLIPLMLLLASALGIFLNSSEMGVQQLNNILNTIFPPQPFATSIKTSILEVLSSIVEHRNSLGLFGFLVLIWTGLALFDSVRSVLHRVYYLKRTKSLIAGLVHDLGFLFLAFIFFIISNVAIWVSTLMERIAVDVPGLRSLRLEGLDTIVPTAIVTLITAVMFYIVYRHMTDSKPPKAAAMISTVTTTIVWIISGKVFALYLTSFSGIATVYGSYAFLLVLLLWIYYSSLIFVFGGIVGQVYWERLRAREQRAAD